MHVQWSQLYIKTIKTVTAPGTSVSIYLRKRKNIIIKKWWETSSCEADEDLKRLLGGACSSCSGSSISNLNGTVLLTEQSNFPVKFKKLNQITKTLKKTTTTRRREHQWERQLFILVGLAIGGNKKHCSMLPRCCACEPFNCKK